MFRGKPNIDSLIRSTTVSVAVAFILYIGLPVPQPSAIANNSDLVNFSAILYAAM